MAATPRRSSAPVLRSLSPAGRFHSPASSSSLSHRSAPFASSISAFTSRCSSSFVHRSTSPTHIRILIQPTRPNKYNNAYHYQSSSSASVRFSFDRPVSPNRSMSMLNQNQAAQSQKHGNHGSPAHSQRKSCMCSPTNHPGSFRCSLHKKLDSRGSSSNQNQNSKAAYSSNQLNMRRSAMTNSLVRIGTVEGEIVKRALAALIHPSSHHQRRREDFKPRPSRLTVMSKADDV